VFFLLSFGRVHWLGWFRSAGGPRCLQVLQEKPALPSGAAGETSASEEVKKLIGDTSTFHQSGPVVAGMKCMMIRDQYADPSSYCLQLKSRKDAEGNSFNICVAIVIAKGTKEANGGQVTAKVFAMVSYLLGAGY
ncbi:Profilin-1, partial [Dissostichus eleginoides]